MVIISATNICLIQRDVNDIEWENGSTAASAERDLVEAVNKIEGLPKRDQKALLYYLDALVQNKSSGGVMESD